MEVQDKCGLVWLFFSSIDKLIKRREIESSEVSLLFLAKSTHW